MEYSKLLSQKSISPIGKLILIDILEQPTYLVYNKTSDQIAISIGCKRKDVLNALAELEENGYIICKVSYRTRITKITKLLQSLIF